MTLYCVPSYHTYYQKWQERVQKRPKKVAPMRIMKILQSFRTFFLRAKILQFFSIDLGNTGDISKRIKATRSEFFLFFKREA